MGMAVIGVNSARISFSLKLCRIFLNDNLIDSTIR